MKTKPTLDKKTNKSVYLLWIHMQVTTNKKIVANDKKSLSGFKNMVKVMEKEAIDTGASKMSISKRMGYEFIKINDSTVILQKGLK